MNMEQTYHHIGIIGFGARGQQLADMISTQLPEYGCVAAAADLRENLSIPNGLMLNCPALKLHRDYRSLLADPGIDSVVITTYPESHVQIAVDAIRAGKAVLCDKPVAGTLEDAVKLYEFVVSTPCRFRIGLNLPYYPVSRRIRELLADGVIGRLLCIRGMCDVGASFGHSTILRKFAGQREGFVLGKLTHDTDLMQFLADSYAEEVYGKTANFLWKRHGDGAGSDDTAVIAGIMHNGILFSQTMTSCGGTYGRRMYFSGSNGEMWADINSEDIFIQKPDGEKKEIHLLPASGSHRGGDKVMFREFLDYADSAERSPTQPERILSSIMIPLAAMRNETVRTGEWFRSIIRK